MSVSGILEIIKKDNVITTNEETSYYRENYIKIITDILNSYENFRILVNLEDDFDSSYTEDIIVQSKKRTDPSNFKLGSLWAISILDDINNCLNCNISWTSKYSIALWRGSSTGTDDTYINKLDESRYKLVSMSDRRKFLDAGFTNIVQYLKDHPIGQTTINDNMNPLDQCRYKYIVVPDGNVSTYSFLWVLATGSVALKQDSEFIQFFAESSYPDKLEPYVHYIPIKRDFSDLFEKIEWCRKNDPMCRKIAKNSKEYAKRNFNRENLYNIIKKNIS